MKSKMTLAVLLLMGVFSLQTAEGSRKVYSTAASFKTAIANSVPGDTIELANGAYDLSSTSIVKSGTAAERIVIKAENRGLAELKGKSSFACKGVSFVTIEGFNFTSDVSTVIKTESCNNIRMTRNVFRLSETTSSKWILIGGTYNIAAANSHHNRIDHNLFENKKQLGNYVTIDGSPAELGTPEASQYDQIDHNHFKNIGPRAVNEMETIRIGQSEICRSNSYTVVEYNLFEECNGDPEIISVKTKNSIVRYNTIRRSEGTVCLRSSDSSTVEGNYFLGEGRTGTGGVRLYGSGHRIINNYFSNLTGDTWDAACTITNGDAELNGSVTAHWRPQNIIVAFNTFIGNANNFQFGFTNNGSYSKAPQYITIANNLVVGSQNQLVKVITQPGSITYSGNIMFPQGSAIIGISATDAQIKNIDPVMTFKDSLWNISAGSPAVNASVGSYDDVVRDIEGQRRDSQKDIGADEFSLLQRYNRPLTAADVGPNAPDTLAVVTSVEENIGSDLAPSHFMLGQNYPNPFNPSTSIPFIIAERSNVMVEIFSMIGGRVAVLHNGSINKGAYTFHWNASDQPSGVYLCRVIAGTTQSTKRMILLK